eukprot:gene11024-12271_t
MEFILEFGGLGEHFPFQVMLLCAITLLFFKAGLQRPGRIRPFSSCQTYCPDPSHPHITSLQDDEEAAGCTLPPLIHHILCQHGGGEKASDIIQAETNLPKKLISELISFGAVYYTSQFSLPTTPKTQKQNQQHQDEEQQPVVKAVKRLTYDRRIDSQAYLRVHVNPRRYRSCQQIEWKDRIWTTSSPPIGSDFIIVNKPAGLPCISTVDNAIENVLYQVQHYLNLSHPLYITTRLDACTAGLLVLAYTSQAAAAYNQAIQHGTIQKVYKVLTKDMLSLGRMTHGYPKRSDGHRNAKPTFLSTWPRPSYLNESDWVRADLEILDSQTMSLDESRIAKDAILGAHPSSVDPSQVAAASGGSGCDDENRLCESRINLLTGRTHQIRMQLSALNNPVIGDRRYSPISGLVISDHVSSRNTLLADKKHLLGPEPARIGLQCDSLVLPAGLLGGASCVEGEHGNMVCKSLDGGQFVQLSLKTPYWRHK